MTTKCCSSIILTTFATPFQGLEKIRLQTEHEMTENALNLELLVKIEQNELKLVSENAIDWSDRVYNGMLIFTSPLQGLEDVCVKINHEAWEQ